jgi:archaemetzincin
MPMICMVKQNRLLIVLCALVLMFSCQQCSAQPEDNNLLPTDSTSRITLLKRIDILPLGEMDTALLTLAATCISQFYDLTHVVILQENEMPAHALYVKRNRYRADTLLRFLDNIRLPEADYIIGLTALDISATKAPYDDWGILGYGYMPGEACIVSTFRLKKGVSKQQFEDRFKKVVLHELGHNFGLPHCPVKGCLMQDAQGTVKTVDAEKMELCPDCNRRMKEAGLIF